MGEMDEEHSGAENSDEEPFRTMRRGRNESYNDNEESGEPANETFGVRGRSYENGPLWHRPDHRQADGRRFYADRNTPYTLYLEGALGIAAHDFNNAMQRPDKERQDKLRRFSSTNPLHVRVEEKREVIDIMLTSRPAANGEPEADWFVHYNGRRTHIYELLLDHILATYNQSRGREHPYYFLLDYLNNIPAFSLQLWRQAIPYSIGVLRAPIGGIFDFSHLSGRLDACAWLRHRIEVVWPVDEYRDCAIFDYRKGSTGSDLYMHDGSLVQVDLVEDVLPGKVFVLRNFILTFESINWGVFVHFRRRDNSRTDPYALNQVREGNVDDLCRLLIRPDRPELAAAVGGLTEALERGQKRITHYFRRR